VGEVGGGMRNEIFGTFILVILGSILAIPVGLMAVFSCLSLQPQSGALAVQFAADILAGIPSIVVGVFAYAMWSSRCTHTPRYRQG